MYIHNQPYNIIVLTVKHHCMYGVIHILCMYICSSVFDIDFIHVCAHCEISRLDIYMDLSPAHNLLVVIGYIHGLITCTQPAISY